MTEPDGMIEELNLKVQLLIDDSDKLARLQVTAKDVKLTAFRVAALRLSRALVAKTHAHASLQS